MMASRPTDMAGGRGRSTSAYSPTPLNKRCRSRGGDYDDDAVARYAGASPKRRKRHSRRYGDSRADEVDDGEVLHGASAAAAPARSREHGRGWGRSSRVAGGGCHYYTPRTLADRSSSSRHSRLDRRASARGDGGGGDEIRERERRSGNSSHGDHARWDHPAAGEDPHDRVRHDDRHRDFTSSSKYSSTSASHGYKQTLRFGNISIDVGRRNKQASESVPSSKNVKAGETATDAGKAVHLQNCTSVSMSMANIANAESKGDSQVPIIAKENITAPKPPASITTRRPPLASAAARIQKSFRPDGLHNESNVNPDNWDDADGYYVYRFGELLCGRYEIIAAHGMGVFSRVVGAKDREAGTDAPERVAIKIIRNNDTMYRAGKQEVSILEKLNSVDRDDKCHCVRFISRFRYRNHLCLVLESLHMNLREVLKKFGRDIGLKLTAVKLYAKQMFIALKLLKACKVLHCDIKPDNIMVNQAKNVLKLCDFGSAMLAGTNEVTPYLVSRYYRAPEIILGLPYDHPLDMWSVGCCLFELCTGKFLFQGKSNNEMLRLHMELKGLFPKKMLRSGAFTMQHFDRDLRFQDIQDHPVKGH